MRLLCFSFSSLKLYRLNFETEHTLCCSNCMGFSQRTLYWIQPSYRVSEIMVLAQDKWSQWAKQIPAFLVLIVREKWKERNNSTALYKWKNHGNCRNITVFVSARTISEIISGVLFKMWTTICNITEANVSHLTNLDFRVVTLGFKRIKKLSLVRTNISVRTTRNSNSCLALCWTRIRVYICFNSCYWECFSNE